MKLSAIIGMQDDPGSFAQYAAKLEDVGVEYLWTGEAYTSASPPTGPPGSRS